MNIPEKRQRVGVKGALLLTAVLATAYANVSGGIRRWLGLGNFVDGDCTVAAYYHINMAKHATHVGPLKKLAYLFGYRPPHSAFAVKEYAAYLATLGEKPPNTGVAVDGWLRWQQAQGHVTAWAQLAPTTPADPTGANFEQRIRDAMVTCGGVILAGDLSLRATNNWGPGTIWDYRPNVPTDQPNPAWGHAIAMLAYKGNRDYAVTWGAWQPMTTAFRSECMNSAFVYLIADDQKLPDYAQRLAFVNSLPNG